jgi:hypothetical protein
VRTSDPASPNLLFFPPPSCFFLFTNCIAHTHLSVRTDDICIYVLFGLHCQRYTSLNS